MFDKTIEVVSEGVVETTSRFKADMHWQPLLVNNDADVLEGSGSWVQADGRWRKSLGEAPGRTLSGSGPSGAVQPVVLALCPNSNKRADHARVP